MLSRQYFAFTKSWNCINPDRDLQRLNWKREMLRIGTCVVSFSLDRSCLTGVKEFNLRHLTTSVSGVVSVTTRVALNMFSLVKLEAKMWLVFITGYSSTYRKRLEILITEVSSVVEL